MMHVENGNQSQASRLPGNLMQLSAYQVIFLISYSIWLVTMLLSMTFFASILGTNILNSIRYLGLAGAFVSVFMANSHSMYEVFGLFLFILLVFITTRTNAPVLLDTIVLVYCGKRIEFSKLANLTLWISTIILGVTVIAAKIGIIQNHVDVSFVDGTIRRREYLGFLYALYPAQLMFNITCLIVCQKKGRITVGWTIALIAANLILYLETNSRLSFFISVAMVVAGLIMTRRIGIITLGNLFRIIAPVAFIACFLLSWYGTTNYTNGSQFYSEINSILGGRLKLGQSALAQYGTSLLGQNINFIGNGLDINGNINVSGTYNYVDCLYVRLPILYGWIFTVIFIAAMTFVACWATRKKDYSVCLILVAIALHCVIDDLVIRLQFCTFLLLMGIYLVEAVEEMMLTKHAFREARSSSSEDRSTLIGSE